MNRILRKVVSVILVVVMLVGIVPTMVFAQGSVTNYDDFMEDLVVLEGYAETYGSVNLRDPGELVLNFIRTGVDRYQDDNWNTLANPEIIAFTKYVEEQDEKSGTSAMDLRNIVTKNFLLPNGEQVDFGHMFGCMNISYVAAGSADLSGWAGDLCDLLYYSSKNSEAIYQNTDGSVEGMAEYILANCFGIDADDAFGMDDFYGDMDAYYIISEFVNYNGKYNASRYKKINKTFSQIMDEYFTGDLDDTDRTVYFMNNRFGVEDSKETVRKAIFESYSSNVGIKLLESKRGVAEENELRQACCYAFADYIYSKAQGQLVAKEEDNTETDNDYYSVFSSEESVLAPGISQKINYAQTVDGRQIVYYVATVDVTRDDVTIMANYRDNDPSKGWGYQTVADQAAALMNNYKNKTDENGNKLYENFNVIVATNADGYNMSTAEPGGLLVMDGVEWHAVDSDGFFAILKTGAAVIGTKDDYELYKSEIQDAVGGFGAVLIKNGKINVTKNANYVSTRASRTAIGIKEDGSVVMMVLDGRQIPFSAGGAIEEIAQIMLDAGCVEAINLDGGGSTTYLSKPAGSDALQLTNRPSDGSARNVATSLVAISTAKPSNEFNEAIIQSDYDYITSGTSMQFSVIGVSNTGNTAPIPKGSYWRVSDENLATIDETGLFTAMYGEEGRITGDVTVEFIVNGEVAGSKTIHLVIPDDIRFAEDRIVAVYGVPKEIELTVWYDGNPVAYTPVVVDINPDTGEVEMSSGDTLLCFPYFDEDGIMYPSPVSNAGTVSGNVFTGSDAEGIRNVRLLALLILGDEDYIMSYATVNLYYEDEATFDFENATMGNRTLAWNREPINAKTLDNQLYRITDPNAPVAFEYTFALDMTAIDIPAQVEPLKTQLPNYREGATAWTYLLQLAQRVCIKTNVTITAEFSENLEVDISELKVINDFFELAGATIDENNVLTVKCNWINQTQPIDADTANPLCILSGIKATVKADADEVAIANNGKVTYDVYLAASSLYSFSQNASNQAEYGLYPYVHEDDCRGEISDELGSQNDDIGAHFSSQYADFADIYAVNNEIRNAWQGNSYYVDNEAVTGIQLIPCKEDTTKKYFYEFDEDGVLIGTLSGLIEYNDGLYYAMNGQPQKRWISLTDENGNEVYYYFDPVTYRAVNGSQQINEGIVFNYLFENYILVRGDLRTHTCSCIGTEKEMAGHGDAACLGYRWAGKWIQGQWVEIDGKSYCFQKYHTVADRGFIYKSVTGHGVPRNGYYLFDQNGVFQKDFTGIYNDYYLENGVAYGYSKRIVHVDGYYYLVNSDLKILKNGKYSVSDVQTGGFVNNGIYAFDEVGRLTTPLVEVTANNKISVTVKADTVTVNNLLPCKVGYLDGDKYVLVTATKVDDNIYKYVLPVGAKAVVVVAGDANGDGKITNADKTKLNAVVLGKTALTPEQEFAADVNGDKKLTNADKTRLNAVILGKTTLNW